MRKKARKGFDHQCDWRKATLMLAKCVVATLQTDGKIGMGTGLVMKVVDGKKTLERWDKDFIEALAFIGIELVDKPKAKKAPPKREAMKASAKKMAAKITAANRGARAA